MAIVRKDGSAFGRLYGVIDGVITLAHTDFYSYTPTGSPLQGNEEDINGTLTIETYRGQLHPVTAQEAKGHGLKAWLDYDIRGDDIVSMYFKNLGPFDTEYISNPYLD